MIRYRQEEMKVMVIKRHDYKPKWKFLRAYHEKPGGRKRYYGIEWEVDTYCDEVLCDIEQEEVARTILKTLEGWIAKYDGSLTENGIEFVSHPMTLSRFMEEIDKMKIAADELFDFGYAWDPPTAGLHIHVSRRSINDEHVYRMVRLIQSPNIWRSLITFSGRAEENINEWAAKYDDNAVIRRWFDSKYRCIAVWEKTLEFRLFAGTLDIETIKGYLIFTDALVRLVQRASESTLAKLSWNTKAFWQAITKHVVAEEREWFASRLKWMVINC